MKKFSLLFSTLLTFVMFAASSGFAGFVEVSRFLEGPAGRILLTATPEGRALATSLLGRSMLAESEIAELVARLESRPQLVTNLETRLQRFERSYRNMSLGRAGLVGRASARTAAIKFLSIEAGGAEIQFVNPVAVDMNEQWRQWAAQSPPPVAHDALSLSTVSPAVARQYAAMTERQMIYVQITTRMPVGYFEWESIRNSSRTFEVTDTNDTAFVLLVNQSDLLTLSRAPFVSSIVAR